MALPGLELSSRGGHAALLQSLSDLGFKFKASPVSCTHDHNLGACLQAGRPALHQ
jgi:hypothetical protein